MIYATSQWVQEGFGIVLLCVGVAIVLLAIAVLRRWS